MSFSPESPHRVGGTQQGGEDRKRAREKEGGTENRVPRADLKRHHAPILLNF